MNKLKELRQKAGWTQKEVAEKLKTSRVNYNRYELGTGEPDIEMLKNMSKVFNVSIDFIVGNENQNVIDLSNLSNIRKELLFDVLNLDDFDCYEKYQSKLEYEKWKEENPEKAEEQRQFEMEEKAKKIEERQKEIEHFKKLFNKQNKN